MTSFSVLVVAEFRNLFHRRKLALSQSFFKGGRTVGRGTLGRGTVGRERKTRVDSRSGDLHRVDSRSGDLPRVDSRSGASLLNMYYSR